MEHIIGADMVERFRQQLITAEKSRATVSKYLHDVRVFAAFANGRAVDKTMVIAYKQHLAEHYQLSSANSMIAALNSFLKSVGWEDCRVKSFKIQREMCRTRERDLSREEYARLLNTAKRRKQWWLYYVMLTICSTGIRVSELPFITVEAISTRRARVVLKGKSRVVILPVELCRALRVYARDCRIQKGSIFITRSGKPIDRSNILHAMKALCREAGVERSKIFPHNLRHLFAVTYYKKEKDVCHLADILGHANINTTRIYTLVTVEEQEQQICSLGLII